MDEISTTLQGSTNTPASVGLGMHLKNAREALRMSEREAAARLRLNARFIDMMEREDFNGVPPMFMRGYLRSYARLVQLDETKVTRAMEQLNLTTSQIALNTPQPITATNHNNHQQTLDRYLRWSSYGIISALFLLVIIWWASHLSFNKNDNSNSLPQAEQAAAPTLPTTLNANTLDNQPNNQNNIAVTPPIQTIVQPSIAPTINTETLDTTKSSSSAAQKSKSTEDEDSEQYMDRDDIY